MGVLSTWGGAGEGEFCCFGAMAALLVLLNAKLSPVDLREAWLVFGGVG